MTVSGICGQSWKEWTGSDPNHRYDLFCRLEPGHPGDHAWLSPLNVIAGDDQEPPAWVSSRYRRPAANGETATDRRLAHSHAVIAACRADRQRRGLQDPYKNGYQRNQTGKQPDA